MSEFYHVSVLLDECLDGLNIKPEGIYVDGTLGGAGHSSQIAARLTTGRLIGIDRDQVALKAAGERLAPYGDRVTLVQHLTMPGSFENAYFSKTEVLKYISLERTPET